ncbi:MAG: hypothetical protein MJE77_39810 [Proteobacteria bacterium]|nr:hypothetical protein [Pseudomonadota bacterium]
MTDLGQNGTKVARLSNQMNLVYDDLIMDYVLRGKVLLAEIPRLSAEDAETEENPWGEIVADYHELINTMQSPTPPKRADRSIWRPCHGCGADTPVYRDLRVRLHEGARIVEETGTISYVCPRCSATQVGVPPDPDLFDKQDKCHACEKDLGSEAACRGCGMPRGWALVSCPYCGNRQSVFAPHLGSGCDLFTLDCVSCEAHFVSTCVC